MRTLSIRFAKKKDGTSVLACTRPDGSSTWQRRRQAFFPLHDLTHYAVETTLGLRYGFYGLLADGWNITDFGDRPFPADTEADAILTEAIVGLLDQERGTGVVPDAEKFNEALQAVLTELGRPFERLLTQGELDTIRIRSLELAGRWTRLEPGTEMKLTFEAGPTHPA